MRAPESRRGKVAHPAAGNLLAQCIAAYLYGAREWTMERVGKALGVSKATISNDLSGCLTTKQPSRPNGGRSSARGLPRAVAQPITTPRWERAQIRAHPRELWSDFREVEAGRA